MSAEAIRSRRGRLLVDLVEAHPSVPQLVDFALQHLGKHYVDADRATDAVACLEEALEVRRAKGDQALIESTLAALRRCGKDAPDS